ncbi:MAG TPA: Maf family protein [Planctomycetota bacterium]|jgi:MAF protein|nr:Maf family protein [Planctomycetota bacterium]
MFILASASPARRKLLRGYRFKVVPSGVREVRRATLRATCLANARRKAQAVARRFPNTWVLAADTMMEFRGRLYGKPRSREAARRLFQALAGRTHFIGTGVVLQKNRFRIERFVRSRVTVRQNPPLEKILARTDPTRFAGGYALKPGRDPLIERVEGSVTNVIGLPMEELEPLLRNLGAPERAPQRIRARNSASSARTSSSLETVRRM